MSEKSEESCSKTSILSLSSIKSMWSTYIAVDFIDEENALVDHLGLYSESVFVRLLMLSANERTWHNWLALSNATSWMGIVVAQMAKISNVVNPTHYHMLDYKACICQAVSVVILLIGTYRFFCEQSAISGTGNRASPWTLLATGGIVLMVCRELSFTLHMTDLNRLRSAFSSCSLWPTQISICRGLEHLCPPEPV